MNYKAPASTNPNLAPAIRASLQARLERLLRRPLIASVGASSTTGDAVDEDDDTEGGDSVFDFLRREARAAAPLGRSGRQDSAWRENPEDGTCSVQIQVDYSDVWRGFEKEVLDTVTGTVESAVTFLTDEQRRLLERSPREFLALNPRPEAAELLSFRVERIGGAERVVALTIGERPNSGGPIRHIAIVPNLVPLERQLAALDQIERATDDGPLAPLRVLLGLASATCLEPAPEDAPVSTGALLKGLGTMTLPAPGAGGTGKRAPRPPGLDEFQSACVSQALATPHFAVIQGPPGSGKTTVISTVIREALARGDRVLVVSPTHVAVDNVVEKLATPTSADDLEQRTLPVRFAARPKKLLEASARYWVGPKKERRGATISQRVERCLTKKLRIAKDLYAREDKGQAGNAPLSAAIAGVQEVICGTPIGVLSYEPVRDAKPGSFGLLVVDEVSKMTLPEFLAVAVKARRWVLVGDPEQLPPYNNAEENGTTLDDVLSPLLELVISVGALIDSCKPGHRRGARILVVSSDPARACAAIRAHLMDVGLDDAPSVGVYGDDEEDGILVCHPTDSDDAVHDLSPARGRDHTHNPEYRGSVSILVERGLRIGRPDFASGSRLVEVRQRAPAQIFEKAFSVYHAQPWAQRSGLKLRVVGFRNGLPKCLPSRDAIRALNPVPGQDPDRALDEVLEGIALRFAINAVSVYDWLTGIPRGVFDTSPLADLDPVFVSQAGLQEVVQPYVGVLEKQYRMHGSLSQVPRRLFYFDEALQDGRPSTSECRVRLVQVAGEEHQEEHNDREVEKIVDMLTNLSGSAEAKDQRRHILVITPYRAQERRLGEAVQVARSQGRLDTVDLEISTLDRCQGREADFVFISLVRGRATPFMDAPKRWNVALTRAKDGLFVFGDIDAYLNEAATARQRVRHEGRGARPTMSLLACILDAYHHQIAERAPQGPRRTSR